MRGLAVLVGEMIGGVAGRSVRSGATLVLCWLLLLIGAGWGTAALALLLSAHFGAIEACAMMAAIFVVAAAIAFAVRAYMLRRQARLRRNEAVAAAVVGVVPVLIRKSPVATLVAATALAHLAASLAQRDRR